MPYEYHVIIVPLYPWQDYVPKDLTDLKKLSEIIDRFFSFNLYDDEQRKPSDA